MRSWARYLVCGLAGLALGAGGAIYAVCVGGLGSSERAGPWRSGRDFGTAEASAFTRATVALHGLLALPAREARYYTVTTDGEGNPLDGKCRYLVKGGRSRGAWWSLTLYDRQGYLVANPANIWSIGSAALPEEEKNDWSVIVSPVREQGHWLPTGGIERFALTLRIYLPDQGPPSGPPFEGLPLIGKLDCR